MNDFIEVRILAAVKKLLSGRVNEILDTWQFLVPIIEFDSFIKNSSVTPVVKLSECERTEKERIILLDAYSMAISFTVPETEDSELFCYGYAYAVCKALGENSTLDGIVDKAVVTGKKYVPPKKANCGMDWEVVISLRITIEGVNNEK